MKHFHRASLALCLPALVAASSLVVGCCNDVHDTECVDWDQSTTCPAPEDVEPKLGDGSGTVTSPGTFWPAHEYEINGARFTEPAACCYDVVVEVCTRELH